MNKYIWDRVLSFYLRQERCDVILKADSITIPCHSLILAATSEFFETMLNASAGWHETTTQEIELHDVDGRALQAIIDFVYTQNLEIGEHNVIALLHAACLVQVDAVVQRTTLYLEDHLDSHNVIALLDYSHRYSLDRLRQRAIGLIKRNFTAVCCQDAFVELSYDTLMMLLQQPGLAVTSEQMLLNVLLRWLHHNLDERRAFADDVLKHVRVSYIPRAWLQQKHNQERNHGLLVPLSQSHAIDTRCGAVEGMLVLVGGFSNLHGRCRSVEMYDSIKCRWEPLPPMEVPRSYFGLTCCHGQIYACGGYSGGWGVQANLTVASVEEFDPLTSSWHHGPELVTARARFTVATLDNCIYAIGGLNAFERPVLQVERLDVMHDKAEWQVMGPLPMPVCDAATALVNNKIYLCGGRSNASNGCHIYDSLWQYDPFEDTWTELNGMPTARHSLSLCVLDNHLYAIGGINPMCDDAGRVVEVYDPATDAWQQADNLPQPARTASATVVDNKCICVVGGGTGSNISGSMLCYSSATQQWTECKGSTIARRGASAVTFRL
eukprot:TRINITY_DN9417_c0_g1_i3.p1 TRINITY_DN9417_c0_g1~~TRINITY_DN9417_c0_g1_i3.p1  ORF type:complete len:551 (+),score=73.72 TRINITY_DN9417_c0_g1_i3:165-1817(+)